MLIIIWLATTITLVGYCFDHALQARRKDRQWQHRMARERYTLAFQLIEAAHNVSFTWQEQNALIAMRLAYKSEKPQEEARNKP
jgi:hypothetical protein